MLNNIEFDDLLLIAVTNLFIVILLLLAFRKVVFIMINLFLKNVSLVFSYLFKEFNKLTTIVVVIFIFIYICTIIPILVFIS